MNKGQWNCNSSNSLKSRDLMEIWWRNSFEDLTQNITKKNIVGWSLIYTFYFIYIWGCIRTRIFFPEFQIKISFGAFQIIFECFWWKSTLGQIYLERPFERVRPINKGFERRSHSIRTVFTFYLNTFFSEIFWNDLKSTLKHFDQNFEKKCANTTSAVPWWEVDDKLCVDIDLISWKGIVFYWMRFNQL